MPSVSSSMLEPLRLPLLARVSWLFVEENENREGLEGVSTSINSFLLL